MLIYLHICVALTLSYRGSNSQVIHLEQPQFSTPCAEHVRANIDTFYFNATFGNDISELHSSGWKIIVTVQVIQPGEKTFRDLCFIALGFGGSNCRESSIYKCFCHHMNTEDDSAQVWITGLAGTNQSDGTIRGEWQNIGGHIVTSTNNVSFPLIFDPAVANLTLKLNNRQIVEKHGFCANDVKVKELNTLELCCADTAKPCYPRMTINGSVVTENNSPCVLYTFTPQDEPFIILLTKSFSVCNLVNYTLAGSCFIGTRIVSEDIVLTTQRSTPETTSSVTDAPTTTQALATTSTTAVILVTSTSSTTPIMETTTLRKAYKDKSDGDGNAWWDLLIAYLILNLIAIFLYYFLKWTNKETQLVYGGDETVKLEHEEQSKSAEFVPQDQSDAVVATGS